MYNSIPFIYDIKNPVPTYPSAKKTKNRLYKETNFNREDKLQHNLNDKFKKNEEEYRIISNKLIDYSVPSNSNDLLETRDYKSFSKAELNDKYIHEIYDMMLENNTENISKERIDGITGISHKK